jgi:hypothetical protein
MITANLKKLQKLKRRMLRKKLKMKLKMNNF